MEIKLCVVAWEQIEFIHAKELAQRLRQRFPAAVIDWGQGDAYVQDRLDGLVAMGAPPVILESHRSQFGNVVFVSVSDPKWSGATAVSYLYTMSPPLGDAVYFDVEGAADADAVTVIARDLGAALGMVPCPELGRKS